MRRIDRRVIVIAAALLAALVACAAPPRRPVTSPSPVVAPPRRAASAGAAATTAGSASAPEREYLRARHLMVPVDGARVGTLQDTFHSGREGGRMHEATDILAPRGTPVLSADDGVVLRVSSNELGGITLYATDPSARFVYYYAHLDRYAKGIREGTRLSKGQVIAYVGTTGNASASAPHLHFQAMRPGDARHVWDGTPIDVRPYLVEDGHRRDARRDDE